MFRDFFNAADMTLMRLIRFFYKCLGLTEQEALSGV
jgi:hypothetical protein